MARTKRIQKYYKKSSWSTRISNIEGAQLVGANNKAIIYYNLCKNPAQDENTVSNKFTVKNIDLQLELSNASSSSGTSDLEDFQVYICYIPQGYVPTGTPSYYENVPFDHPEWIMVHRYVGLPLGDAATSYLPLHIKSRLARKLDTGDRVVLIILGKNTSTSQGYTIDYRGLVKYNTKAN